METRARFASVALVTTVVASAAIAACGSSGSGGQSNDTFGSHVITTGGSAGSHAGGAAGKAGSAGASASGGAAGKGGAQNIGNLQLKSIAIDPPMATLDVTAGMTAMQPFKVVATMMDGSTKTIASNVKWATTVPQIGAIDGTGTYTANGSVGGVDTIKAEYMSLSATAQLTVKLHVDANPAMLPAPTQMMLKNATTADPTVQWAYPYDGTVWPRGLGGPLLMWNGGTASDVVYVKLTSATFDYEAFLPAPAPAQVPIDDATWQKFVDSTSGAAHLFVARWDGTAATKIADLAWTVAPASMRGTIYYWANNLGRVMRIKPGATMPDDFANQPPLNDPSMYKQSSCLMTCHTVSADGSTLVSGGGTFGGSYDLKTGQPIKSLGGTWGLPNENDWTVIQWMMPAVAPDGKMLLVNSLGLALSLVSNPAGPANFGGFHDTTTGAPIPSGALDGVFTAMPAMAPDGSIIAFVDSGDPTPANPTPWASWLTPNPGDLKLVDFNEKGSPLTTNLRTLVSWGADPTQRILWPTISPDANWIVYQRGGSADTRQGPGDLFLASTKTANQETRLAALDGDGYPFAAGDRDRHLNYEPAFAPVAAGGYFWVVFTSRRTYGNILTDQPFPDMTHSGTKQLWVAAIDQSPQPGKDPSHAPFRLPGQSAMSVNMRAFWALDPCKGDGVGCDSGTECCGGYCVASLSGQAQTCSSKTTTCSQDGDHCDKAADCCDAANGELCINHVCSQPPLH